MKKKIAALAAAASLAASLCFAQDQDYSKVQLKPTKL